MRTASAAKDEVKRQWLNAVEMASMAVTAVGAPITYPFNIAQWEADEMAGIYLNETAKIDSLSALIQITTSDILRGISWGIPAGELVAFGSFLVHVIPSRSMPALAMISNSVISGALSTVVISGLASVPSIVRDCHRYYMDATDSTSGAIKLAGSAGTVVLGYLARKGMVPIVTNVVAAMFESIGEVGFVTEQELIRQPLREGNHEINMHRDPGIGDRVGVAYPRDEHGITELAIQNVVPSSILFLFRHNRMIAAAVTRMYARLHIVGSHIRPSVGKMETRFKLPVGEQVMVFAISWAGSVIIGYVIDFVFGRLIVGKTEHKKVIIETFNQTLANGTKVPVDPRWDPNVGAESVGLTDEKPKSDDSWFIIGIASVSAMVGLGLYLGIPADAVAQAAGAVVAGVVAPDAPGTPDVSEIINQGVTLARGVEDMDRSRQILQDTASIIDAQIGVSPLTMPSPIAPRYRPIRKL